MRAALTTTLSAEGFDVFGSSWNSQTMRTAAKLRPYVILLSVGTSSWDDFKTISSLREQLPSTLVVALITGEIAGHEQAALDEGAHLVINKTASRSVLLNTLHNLIQKNQPVSRMAEK